MTILAETVRDGIRYTLHSEDIDTSTLLRFFEDCLSPGVLAVQSWDRYGWWSIWARDGEVIVGHRYDDDEDRETNLSLGIHLHYANGYCQGDVIRIAHNGTLSQADTELIHSLVFDGIAYAVAERWTDTGFETIDAIGGLTLLKGPEETLEHAIRDYLGQGE